jgi:SNF2 family DNA or RNA helicase
MIRNRRHDTGIEWTKRIVQTIPVEFSPKERELYDAITSFKGNGLHPSSAFSILTLQREACSSREAVYMTLKNMLERQEDPNSALTEHMITPLMELLQQVPQNAKAEKVLELVQKIDDKVIIFTEYRATQLYLQWYLKQHGITSVPFRGGFKRGKKDWMKQLFESHAQVFIATEAGGEGINLQFCHHIINYDLPWNPMRLEQRIGRVHRLGQKHDVHIYNLAIQHTVEEHILKLLYEKINLFERVVGELDDILTKLDLKNIEEHIQDILFHSRSEGEIKIKMENLTSIIQYEDSEEDQHAAN